MSARPPDAQEFLFAGSDAGGERTAIAYAILGSRRLAGVDPREHLADVLPRLTGRIRNAAGGGGVAAGTSGASLTPGAPGADGNRRISGAGLIAIGGINAAAFDVVVTPAGWIASREAWAAAWFDRSLIAELGLTIQGRSCFYVSRPD